MRDVYEWDTGKYLGQIPEALEMISYAKAQGYEGEACGDCGQMTMVRNGTCLKCVSCGGTSGCS